MGGWFSPLDAYFLFICLLDMNLRKTCDAGRAAFRQGKKQMTIQQAVQKLQVLSLDLDWWEENLQQLGILRKGDRIIESKDKTRLSLDLGGKFRSYDKDALYRCIKSASLG